jgi:hypothetical protein
VKKALKSPNMILKVHIFVLRGRKEKGCKKISKAGMFSNSGITALHKKRKEKISGIIASFYWWCLSKCIQEDSHVEIID